MNRTCKWTIGILINAYKAGVPANGTPLPDGAKMVRFYRVRQSTRK